MRLIQLLSFLLFLHLSVGTLCAQTNEYFAAARKADSLLNSKKYNEAAIVYSSAFKSWGWGALEKDRYNAAVARAQSGALDSAFYYLRRLVDRARFSKYAKVKQQAEFKALRKDDRWKVILKAIKENEKTLDKKLVAKLEKIHYEDQTYRLKLDTIRKKYGLNSPEDKALWKVIKQKDSLNQQKVCKILDKHGWLGPGEVGQQGNEVLYLVIQHADLATQEKYLPIMREAVKQKKARAANLAYLEDRVALAKGGEQLYGSQMMIVHKTKVYIQPIKDPNNLDKRRSEVGLGPMNDYMKHYGLSWSIEYYESQLREFKAWKAQQK